MKKKSNIFDWRRVFNRKGCLDYLDEFIREESVRNLWEPGTLQNWHAFRKHLENSIGNTPLSHFDDDGILDFITYLRVNLGMDEVTVQKYYLCLRWFLNWALRKKIIKEKSIGTIRPKFKVVKKPIIFLSKEELMKVYHLKIPRNGSTVTLHNADGKPYSKKISSAAGLEKARDMFCFCAFTGLRYSDMSALKRSDIHAHHIEITSQKTYDSLPIDLNRYACEIIRKYNAEDAGSDEKALPCLSRQKLNTYIKTVCELCEINEMISTVSFCGGERKCTVKPKFQHIGSHTGRKTFICIALSEGISPQIVMKWTGHSDWSSMKPYIDIVGKAKAEAMDIIESKLDKVE